MNKKGAGLISNLVSGVSGLIVLVVITLVILSTILTANLLGVDTVAGENGTFKPNQTVSSMAGNFTTGLGNISAKIPTILLIAAVVLLFGVLVVLVRNSNMMTGASAGGSL